MNFRTLISYILLSALVLLLLSTVVQAAEYKKENTEVQAEEILKHIEYGDDINLTNCSITGKLSSNEIDLETVPKTRRDNLIITFGPQEYYDSVVIDKLKVVDSNISIQYSVFENDFDFSNVKFNNNVSFRKTSFNGYAKFWETDFNGSSDFSFSNFSGHANFWETDFNGPAEFYDVSFNGQADFFQSKFSGPAEFGRANFNDLADFFESTYIGPAQFYDVNFSGPAYFQQAEFKDSVEFSGASPVENIFTSEEKTCQQIMDSFKNQGGYGDADIVYYNYRMECFKEKNWNDMSKWMDILTWATCGYGVKPFNSFLFGTAIIFLFSCIYVNPIRLSINRSKRIPVSLSLNVSLNKSNNKIIPFKLYLKNPGIVKDNDHSQRAFLLDLFCYSVCRFTFMSYENWYCRDNFRIVAIIEGVLGWATLGIFMATLSAVMIRA